MSFPRLEDLPPPPSGKTGWPWTANGKQQEGSRKDAVSTRDGAIGPGPKPLTSSIPPTPQPASAPRISLVMPCLNAATYIEEALRSVLLQAYPDLELMVFDGGSTDGTVEIIKRYEPWLTYWESEKDRGQSHAINKGLARATGELFNWVNADDVVCANGLITLVTLHLQHPECAGVFGAMEVFDSNGHRHTWRPVSGGKEDLGAWGLGAFLPQPSALFCRKRCQAVGGLDERLHYVMDIDLILRLCEYGGFAVTQVPTYRYRYHEGAKTVRGEIAGMVELIATEFNMGMPKVAERWLEWRQEGAVRKAIDQLPDTDVAKIVDGWGYGKITRYLLSRLRKNLMLRFGMAQESRNHGH